MTTSSPATSPPVLRALSSSRSMDASARLRGRPRGRQDGRTCGGTAVVRHAASREHCRSVESVPSVVALARQRGDALIHTAATFRAEFTHDGVSHP